MPCMCGDTACPSCGPAQGCDPEREKFLEDLAGGRFGDLFELVENQEEDRFEWSQLLTDLVDHVFEQGSLRALQEMEQARAEARDAVRREKQFGPSKVAEFDLVSRRFRVVVEDDGDGDGFPCCFVERHGRDALGAERWFPVANRVEIENAKDRAIFELAFELGRIDPKEPST